MVVEAYFAPHTLEEALSLTEGEEVLVLAGGTDLMPQTRAGARKFKKTLLNITGISELKGVTASPGTLRIGALTTVSEILLSKEIQQAARVLVRAADCFAGPQVRNAATIGGNICNASPAGDLIVPLLLLDASVELRAQKDGKNSRRFLPLTEFLLGPGKTALQAGEILTAVEFPRTAPANISSFVKFGVRPALDISIVSVGFSCTPENGHLTQVRCVFGAVAPTAVRAKSLESALEGKPLCRELIEEVLQLIDSEVSPISDVRASAWYRRELLETLTRRILQDVAQKTN